MYKHILSSGKRKIKSKKFQKQLLVPDYLHSVVQHYSQHLYSYHCTHYPQLYHSQVGKLLIRMCVRKGSISLYCFDGNHQEDSSPQEVFWMQLPQPPFTPSQSIGKRGGEENCNNKNFTGRRNNSQSSPITTNHQPQAPLIMQQDLLNVTMQS